MKTAMQRCVWGVLIGALVVACSDGVTAGGETNTAADAPDAGAAEASADLGADASPGCSADETACDGRCANLRADRENCGACGNVCPGAEVCVAGSCAVACPAGQTVCSGACVTVATDEANCGECGKACASGESCEAGKCVVACPATQNACNGACVSLDRDRDNCGSCGRTCGGPRGYCQAGDCIHRIFTTLNVYPGNLGGLAGADSICQAEADAASLGGKWRAWLSDSVTSAAARLPHGTAPYELLDGTRVANDWADLTDGSLATQLDMLADETHFTTPSPAILAWTDTTAAGAVTDPTRDCAGWTSSEGSSFGYLGDLSEAGQQWTQSNSLSNCNVARRLYCFED